MVVGINASGVTIGEGDLDGVVPYLGCCSCAGFRFEHGKGGRRSESRRGFGERFFFGALVIASGAGAMVTEVNEFEMGDVAVGPGDVNTGVCRDVNFDRGWFAAGGEWNGHGDYGSQGLESSEVQQPEEGKGLP